MWKNGTKNYAPLVKKIFGDKYSIKSSESNELSVGENYQSKIISIDLENNKKTDTDQNDNLSIIIKMPPRTKDFREICDLHSLFKKEIYMYETILPAYKKFEIDSGINESELLKFIPLHYGSQLNSNPEIDFHEDDDTFIVLENLKTKGYYTVDRKIGADLDHSKIVVQALAKFHSTGIAMKHKKPEEFEILKKESSPPKIKHPRDWDPIIENVYKLIESDTKIEKFVDSCKKLYNLEAANRTSTPPEPWTSIIHGDATILNILFHKKPDTSILDDVKFVDFQNHGFTSPLRELAFFLATGTNQKVFNNHYNELLDLYYDTLKYRLTLFGIDTELYSKESFDLQYRYDAQLHFPHCIAVLQIVTLDFEINDEGIENITKHLQNSPRNDIFCEKLRDIVLLYNRRGWFDGL